MKWLTIKEAKAAGKKSKRAAIACSKKHWYQNWQAKEAEMKLLSNAVGGHLCALCHRYSMCQLGHRWCPLRKPGDGGGCCEKYRAAYRAYYMWQSNRAPYSTFTKKAKAMYDRICEL